MTLDEVIGQFREGKLSLDFAEVQFKPRNASKKPTYIGPGLAKQTPEGVIEVECSRPVASKEGETPRGTYAIRSGLAGTIYTDDEYYECEARDQEGGTWTAHRVLVPESDFWPLTPTTIVRPVHAIHRREPTTHANRYLRLELLKQSADDWGQLYGVIQQVAVPSQSLKFDLEVRPYRDSGIVLTATSEINFPASFEWRLIEALEFVLDLSLNVSILDQSDGTTRVVELRTPRVWASYATSYPPITPRTPGYGESVRQLVSRYLDYIFRYEYADERDSHPCSNFLFLIRESSGVSFDAWALGISVAAEGIAACVNYDIEPQSGDLAGAKCEIRKLLAEANYSKTTMDRIEGSLKEVGNPHPKDAMISLVAKNHAIESDVKAWSKLRSSSVHRPKLIDHSTTLSKVKERYERVLCVYRLIYGMIFDIIGYEGEYSNYAKPGFPIERFPFRDAAEPA
jgi:hypothetical protein